MSHFRLCFLLAASRQRSKWMWTKKKKITQWWCPSVWKHFRATLTCGIHKMVLPSKLTAALLQRALGASTFQSRFEFLGVRGAVVAAENHLPFSALRDTTANTRGRCSLAGSGAIHTGNLARGRARTCWLVALQLLPHHLSLTCKLWTFKTKRDIFTNIFRHLLFSIFHFPHLTCVTGRSRVARLTVADWLAPFWHTTLPASTALRPASQRLLPSIAVLTLVAITTLATVGLTLRHTQTMNTSAVRRRQRKKVSLETMLWGRSSFGSTV